MSGQKDGGPAFPHGPLGMSYTGEDGYTSHQEPAHPGMSLRDYFAAAALQGATASGDKVPPDYLAGWCYEMADWMLEARERKYTKEGNRG